MNHVLELLGLDSWSSLVDLAAFLLMQRKRSIANMTSTRAAPAAATAITWVVVLNHEPPPPACVVGVCGGELAGVLGGEELGTPFRPGFPEYLQQVKNFKPCFQHSSCMFKYAKP
jgi:hypothetical protein